jgi:hypothetical protein
MHRCIPLTHRGLFPSAARHPWFFRSTDGGEVPPGYYPSLFATALASVHAEESGDFLVHEAGSLFPLGTSTKFVSPTIAPVPFFKA